MKRRSVFGSHLYGQIVYPLLAASIVVGVVATVVAVYFLEDLTTKWVAQVAKSSTQNVANRYREHARILGREARLTAATAAFTNAEHSRDASAITEVLNRECAVLELDLLAVVEASGSVVASSSTHGQLIGSVIGRPGELQGFRGRTAFLEIGGRPLLTACTPIGEGGSRRLLVAAVLVDNGFLNGLGLAQGSGYCVYDSAGRVVARAIGSNVDSVTATVVDEAMLMPDPGIREALDRSAGREPTPGEFRSGESKYQVWAEPLALPGPASDDSRPMLVGVVSQSVSNEAGRTTRNLIIMWSAVAVVALVGLGGWVARRVSDPLVELASGARRIAEGDFSTKVEVAGANEVAELADTFNQMTDSLRERSESLTKKVLELATLYEMSRSLGATLDMDELLGSVLDSALRIFDLDLGYVTLRDKFTGSLSVRAVRGGSGTVADGAVRSSMSEWVVREGRPLIFNPDGDSNGERVDQITGARAALCVPLVSSEGTIGAITVGSSRTDYRFNTDDVRLLSTIANHVTIAVGNIELFTSLQEAYLATVRSLAAAVDAKDSYTRGHSDRVAQYATMIAERMGLSHEQRIALEMAAYLHDIGKIGIAEEILLKPGRLDDVEMSQMRHHPLIGANILKPVAFPWAITPVVRHHHESFDGNGYPAGLRGEEIPLLARILTVADSYEAMTADRPYRRGRSVAEAVTELRACSETQFDPRVVDAFVSVVEELEHEGHGVLTSQEVDEISPEEARAIFTAVVDGLFVSFRRLGGPRLASNVESDADKFLAEQGMPFRVVRGRVAFSDDAPAQPEQELELMRAALRRIDLLMGRVSGVTLVDHFYADAFASLSSRMREAANLLGFYTGD